MVVTSASVRPARFDLSDQRWLAFVSSRREATPFHHPEWAQFVADVYGFGHFAFCLVDSQDRIVAGVPLVDVKTRLRKRSWVSLPFTDYCQPLVDEGHSTTFIEAIDAARSSAGVVTVEVRGPFPGTAAEETHMISHVLPLAEDPGAITDRFRPAVRRNIRTGRRKGVTVRVAESRSELLETFFRLQLLTRRRLGLPAQPRHFFAGLWERVLERDLGFLMLAHVGRRPVAGAVFLAWNDTVTYKYGASNSSYFSYRPNHVLFDEAIRWACLNRFQRFEFGRSSKSDVGLCRFKESWGPYAAPVPYTELGTPRRPHSQRTTSALSVALRRSPLWLVRALGEAFYRYEA